MRKSIEKNALFLAAFAIICTFIVGGVHHLTKDEIAVQAERQLLKTLNDVIDPKHYNNSIYQSCILIEDNALGGNKAQSIYLATQDNTPVAAALTITAPDGYNGNINLLVAVNINGEVSGVRTLSHQETPGLGDKIETRKSDWIYSFTGKKRTKENDTRWAVSKDGGVFDQFTGATITPRAVVKAVTKAVDYFNQHQSELFNTAFNCYSAHSRKNTSKSSGAH